MLVCGADPRFCAINPASVTTSRARMRATGSARRHALRSLIGILVSFATPHPIGAWEKPNPISRNVQTKWSALRVRTIIAAAKRALFLEYFSNEWAETRGRQLSQAWRIRSQLAGWRARSRPRQGEECSCLVQIARERCGQRSCRWLQYLRVRGRRRVPRVG